MAAFWDIAADPAYDMLFSYYVCPDRVGRHIVFPRASVRLSVRHKSCPLFNLKTVKDFSMKLNTLVNHDETMCHAQGP